MAALPPEVMAALSSEIKTVMDQLYDFAGRLLSIDSRLSNNEVLNNENVSKIGTLEGQMTGLLARMLRTENQFDTLSRAGARDGVGSPWSRKNILNNKAVAGLCKFNGDGDKWDDWEFSFEQALSSEHPMFGAFLKAIRDAPMLVTLQDIDNFRVNNGMETEEIRWMCEALWLAVANKTAENPLAIVKG